MQDPVYYEGLDQTFEGLWAECLADKIAMDQLRCSLTNYHRIWRSESLESRRNIRRLTEGKLFLPSSSTDFTHHDQTSMDTEPYCQPDALVVL